MRIMIITHVYPPEYAPAGIMAVELAEELTRAGHQVTVLTGFPSHPSGRLFPGWRARLFRKERTDSGFTLVRCIHSFVLRFGFLGKLWYYLTFAVTSFVGGMLQGPFDVLVIQSTPIFGPVTATWLAKVRRAKLFYWIHDVHPESAVHAGVLKKGILLSIMKAIDTWVCRKCDLIGTMTDDMCRLILERGLPADRVVIQRHWLDENRIHPMPKRNAWRERQGIPSADFVALHAGTVGYISGASVLIEAAELLKGRHEISFLFVGDGPLKAVLQEKVKECGLPNVKFLPFQPEEDLSLMQAAADVGLVALKPLSGTSSIPSKLYGYISAGRPVIASVDPNGSVARIVTEGGFGWIVAPNDSDALTRAIIYAASNPEECRCRGEKAREFFVREFGRTVVVREFCRKLETLYEPGRQGMCPCIVNHRDTR